MRAAHEAPAIVPIPEITPRVDHAPEMTSWMLYSRSEDVRSAIAPIRKMKGLNTIHNIPERRDFHFTVIGDPKAPLTSPLIGRMRTLLEGAVLSAAKRREAMPHLSNVACRRFSPLATSYQLRATSYELPAK